MSHVTIEKPTISPPSAERVQQEKPQSVGASEVGNRFAPLAWIGRQFPTFVVMVVLAG